MTAGKAVGRRESGVEEWFRTMSVKESFEHPHSLSTHINRLRPPAVTAIKMARRGWPAIHSAMQLAIAVSETTSGEPATEKNRMMAVSSVDEWACTNRRTVSSNWRVSPSSISCASRANNTRKMTAQANPATSGVLRRESTVGLFTEIVPTVEVCALNC